MKNNISNKIIVISITVLIYLSIILLLALPKKELSENENRYLADFPTLNKQDFFSGNYMRDIEIYINDHFPFRDFIVGIKSKTEKLIGKTDQNGIYFAKDEFLIQSFDGYDANTMEQHAQIISDFSKKINSETYFMLVPTSNGVYPQKKPAFAYDQNPIVSIEKMYDILSIENKINVHDALLENAQKQPLYFRLDHHWNMHGAYIGYTEFCKAANLTPYSKEYFSINEISDNFNGTYYSFSKYYSLKPDTIELYTPNFKSKLTVEYVSSKNITNTLYNEKHLEVKDQYAYFLDGNHPQIIIENEVIEDDSSIAVIKDSYANIFIPFLVHHYKHVYVIDMRFFSEKLSEYVQNNQIQNVLFLYNIHTIREDMGILKVD